MKFYLFHIIATMSRPRLGLGFSDQKSDVLSSQTIETSVLIAHGYTYTSEKKNYKPKEATIQQMSNSKKAGPSYHHPKVTKSNCGDRT